LKTSKKEGKEGEDVAGFNKTKKYPKYQRLLEGLAEDK
jgi:hypothetical protein